MRTKLMQNLGVTNKEHYGMLWYFLEWSIRQLLILGGNLNGNKKGTETVNDKILESSYPAGFMCEKQ